MLPLVLRVTLVMLLKKEKTEYGGFFFREIQYRPKILHVDHTLG